MESNRLHRVRLVPAQDAFVESGELPAAAATGTKDKQFIRKVSTGANGVQGSPQPRLVFKHQIVNRRQSGEIFRDLRGGPIIEIPQHPVGFCKHKVGDEEGGALAVQQPKHSAELRFVVL